MFFVAGIGLAVFIEFLLLSKKNKSTPDKILTVWMFLVATHLFLFYIHFTKEVYHVPFLLGVGIPLPLLHGVFLYLYVCFLTNQTPENKKVLLLHFIPVTVTYLYLITFFTLPAEQKVQVYKNHGSGYELFNLINHYAILSSGIFYVTWSGLLLRKHRNTIQDQFSNLEKVNLQWLRVLTYGMGGIWFLVIFTRADILIYSGVVVFVFLIGFFGVRQAAIFTPAPQKPIEIYDKQKEKYQKSGLSEEASEELHQKLKSLMTEENLYRKSDLSINDLAEKLSVHANYLSQVINQKDKKNFYDFVNTYRMEEFKRLIAQQKNQQFTLLSLAYDCGFSSKTSFNRYFKKVTGKTPSEYAISLSKSQI
jgi:AraC-like DNA-binding protein